MKSESLQESRRLEEGAPKQMQFVTAVLCVVAILIFSFLVMRLFPRLYEQFVSLLNFGF